MVHTVQGTVISQSDGEPIPGATVVLKNTTKGTVTDIEGKFTLEVPDENAILIISFVGYRSEEIPVNNQTTIEVLLEEDLQGLEEVVVVGYGEQKKETLTGSVVNVKGDEVVASPSANVTNSLAGRLPGLVVNQRSGEPGKDDPNILIRGNSTLGNNSPLIIIDGVQRSLMGRLNPEDIEDITVLKDASAAIYGARAANGVIIITTKKGKVGKPSFNLSYNQAFNQPTRMLEVMDGPTFADVYNEAAWYRAGRPENFNNPYSEDFIQQTRDGSDPVLYPDTDWVGEVLKPHSLQSRLNLSVNGGGENTRYFVSLGMMNQNGNFKNNPTSYEQYNFRAKLDVDISDDLTVGLNISGILNNGTYPSTGVWAGFYNILHASPLLVAQYPNGLIGPGRLGQNPLLRDQVGTTTTEDVPIYSTFTAEYKVPFLEGMKISGSYNYDISHRFEKTFRTPFYFYEYNVNTEEYDRTMSSEIPVTELTDRFDKWTTSLYNIKIHYDKSFDQHNIGVMLGNEQQKNTNKWVSAYRRNFVSTAIPQINVGSNAPEDKNNGGSASYGGYNNYFGRLNYNFDERYLAEFVFRYDGSQIFPKENRYGFFPAFSAGWRISEENFIKNNLPSINQLKVRVSHGKIGNDKVGQFQYLQAFSFGDNYVFGGGDVPGIYPNTMPNPNITWEESIKTDIGLELGLWNGLLGLDLTYFKEDRNSILAKRNLSISAIYGFSGLPDENIGEVKSQGYEAIITHRNQVGEFNYNLSGNVSYARTEVVYLDEVPPTEEYQAVTGRPVGAPLYYHADGIFNTEEELEAYPHLAAAQVGDIKLVDLNEDGQINAQDQARFDYSETPEFVFGLNASAQYKGFDFSMLWQGQTNAYNLDTEFRKLGTTGYDNTAVARAEDRWTVDNPDGSMPRADDASPSNNTFWVFDASFVRLKQVELGYTLPKPVSSSIKMDNVRLYISGFNMLTFAKNDWTDPERSGGYLFYPQLRTMNLGVNIKF
ncbi:TonB-dependent receptor [Echinicola strongylocentroti]|uniref:TonB-dependent receptor n=2 Tax=Echinicola strongylocentroti TaxID=1795355 RepID=A0A2Z4ISN2_9BACT|nr:TonB-dependent receptor [Echinicola strongylocentroti]